MTTATPKTTIAAQLTEGQAARQAEEARRIARANRRRLRRMRFVSA